MPHFRILLPCQKQREVKILIRSALLLLQFLAHLLLCSHSHRLLTGVPHSRRIAQLDIRLHSNIRLLLFLLLLRPLLILNISLQLVLHLQQLPNTRTRPSHSIHHTRVRRRIQNTKPPHNIRDIQGNCHIQARKLVSTDRLYTSLLPVVNFLVDGRAELCI